MIAMLKVCAEPPPPPPPPLQARGLEMHKARRKRKRPYRFLKRLVGTRTNRIQASAGAQGRRECGACVMAVVDACGVTLSVTEVVPPSLREAYWLGVLQVTLAVD